MIKRHGGDTMKKAHKEFGLWMMLIAGAIPFVLGSIQNKLMMYFSNEVLPFYLMGALFWVFWGLLAFGFHRKMEDTKKVVVLLNLIAAIDLLLLSVQELIVHAYWMNRIGVWSQLFYLPMIKIGFTLADWSHTVFSAYAVSFVLMIAASVLGCRISVSYGEIK